MATNPSCTFGSETQAFFWGGVTGVGVFIWEFRFLSVGFSRVFKGTVLGFSRIYPGFADPAYGEFLAAVSNYFLRRLGWLSSST